MPDTELQITGVFDKATGTFLGVAPPSGAISPIAPLSTVQADAMAAATVPANSGAVIAVDGVLKGPGGSQNTVPPMARIGGARIGVFGASLEEQNYQMYKAGPDTYTFNSTTGMCSVRTTNPFLVLPGQEIGVSKETAPSIEGVFTVVSATAESGGTRITWYNPNGIVDAGADGANIRITHRSCWNFGSSWVAFMIGFMGGRAYADVIACGGAQLANLDVPTRMGLFLSRGPYDITISSGGGVGNATAIGDYSSTEILQQLLNQAKKMASVSKKSFFGFPHTPIGKTPTDGPFTRGFDLSKRMYREFVQQLPYVHVVQTAEVMNSNYSPYNVATPSTVANSTADPLFLNPDGTHYCYRGAWRIGAVMAEAVSPDLQDCTPYNNAYADNRTINTANDKGLLNRSLIPGYYGLVTPVTLTGTGNSGLKPDANWTVAYASRGGAATVGSVETNPRGGANFVLTVTDTAPSAGGAQIGISWRPPELLAALQNTALQGKLFDLWMPLAVSGFNDRGLVCVECKLAATVGGIEYEIAGCLTDNTSSEQAMQTLSLISPRDMGDEGISGVFRSPRFVVPVATYTDARLVWTIKHNTSANVPGGPGTYRFVIGPQTKLELVEY